VLKLLYHTDVERFLLFLDSLLEGSVLGSSQRG
jgi:hypothetical protein